MILKNYSDKILIENLELFCIIGVNKWERITPQKITINLEIETNLNPSIKSDAIEDTVNYRNIVKKISKIVESSNYNLLESLAARIASDCLTEPKIHAINISVYKPGAVRNSKSVGVCIRRENNNI